MKTSEFSYHLPPELIAQRPARPRDHSRLFVPRLPRDNPVPDPELESRRAGRVVQGSGSGLSFTHCHFYDLPQYLNRGDVLVFNDTKVFPARLKGRKASGGQFEILLLEQKTANTWTALLKPGKNMVGQKISFASELSALVVSRDNEIFTLKFSQSGKKLGHLIDHLGQAPTPPYIKSASNLKEYQTIYAKHRGSAAAPTAGFHFTPALLKRLKKQGVQFEYVTLHVGLGTFRPVKESEIEKHKMHSEKFSVAPDAWQRLLAAKKEGKRIIAVGTTTCRVLETIAGGLNPSLSGATNIFITPGYHFKMTDGLITNFHLPESTLLMLVSALIGDKIKDPPRGTALTKEIYQAAIEKRYRFYSFGDSMLII